MDKKFHFTHPFLESFEETMAVLSEQLDRLNDLSKHMSTGYGIYNCSYKMRYITPSDVGEYISNVHKGVMNNLIGTNPYDTEMFSVESAKRFIQNHDCVPFDAPSINGNSFAWKEHMTLQDLLLIHANDVYNKEVCSPFEQQCRYESFKNGDLKIITDLHISANMKKIVDQFPDLVTKMENGEMYLNNPLVGKLFRALVEEFIIFATTLNMITISNMCKYLIPSAVYSTVSPSNEKHEDNIDHGAEEEKISEYVTECCFLKTNGMVINKRIPFNVNMRNIVLQDMTPNLDDTRNAVRFILNDSKSPIHDLLVKYATVPRGEYGAEMVKQAFLTHSHGWNDSKSFAVKTEPYAVLNKRTGFDNSDPSWLDKIVYGNQYLDGNYRDDNPGNQHVHPITYDISTIYRMFSCHHNDNEHLANNIVKVGNIMCGLVNDYVNNRDVVWDNLKDILVVFAEILTKDMLALYHNNNNSLECRDDMNDTMIPAYMYCEQFYLEADETPKADSESNNKPTIQNKTEGLKEGTKVQNLMAKLKVILQKFAEYIRNVISNIFPKFNENHKAERAWIESHKALNDEIGKALGDSFKITINDYPYFKVPYSELTKETTDGANELKEHLSSPEKFVEWAKNVTAKGNTNIAAEEAHKLLYSGVKDAITVDMLSDKNNTDQIVKIIRNYTLYSNVNGIENQNKDLDLTPELWKKDIIDLLTNDFDKTLKDTTAAQAKIMSELTNALKRIVDKIEAEEKKSSQGENNNNQPEILNYKSFANQLFESINMINKNCYVASVQALIKDVYGKSYNMYRDIVNEYQRQKSVGVEKPNNTTNDQTSSQTN